MAYYVESTFLKKSFYQQQKVVLDFAVLFSDGIPEVFLLLFLFFANWDDADVIYDYVDFTGHHTGYRDIPATIDIPTYRTIPWENSIFFSIEYFNTYFDSLYITHFS